MRVMVVGGGAREHALVARLATEPNVQKILCAPGNPGISAIAEVAPVGAADVHGLAQLASAEDIDLTVVGPELPLSLGIADRLAADHRNVFGPTQAAARLESSKAFAKAFMARHGVPTARFHVCDDLEAALATIHSGEFRFPLVLKADGLAAGKGVVIAEDRALAESTARAAMRDRRFGDAGARLIVEECLTGPEVSFFVIADGDRALPFGTAQDHKRIFDYDRGPNTGGMGAFAPSPLIDEDLHHQVMTRIVEPVLAGMKTEGYPFRGFLYVGLMLTEGGPKVIEFNVRLGDPEAQVILPLLSEPLLPLMMSAVNGRLTQNRCVYVDQKLVGVVLASRGYPESFESGCEIDGLDRAESVPGVSVFHGGTARRDGRCVTAGGRVLTVVGQGSTYQRAAARAYEGIGCIAFEGMQYRRDIGQRAMKAEPTR